MFDTQDAGLPTAPTNRQAVRPMLPAPIPVRVQRGRRAACSAVLHAAAVLLMGRLLWLASPAEPDAGRIVTMVFAPPQPRPQQRLSAPPSASHAAQPVPAPAEPARVAPAASPVAGTTGPAMPPHRPRRTPRQIQQLRPALAAPAPSPPAPAAFAAPAAAGPAPAPQAIDPATLAGFTRQVQIAVQAAALYPPVARRTQVQGRVQVRFDFSGGAVSAIAVAIPGPSTMLDRAALSAVRTAAYPPAPAAWAKAHLPLIVWVDFHLQTDG